MSLAGKTICFTGTLSMVRKDATAKAQAAGASVGGSVTNNTDILIAGTGAGAKEAAAKAKGIAVWTEAEFIAALAGGGSSSGGRSAASLPANKPKVGKKAAAASASSSRSGELLSQGLGAAQLFEAVFTSHDLLDLILEQGGLPAAAQPLCKAWAARATAAIARWSLLTSEWTRSGVRVESEWVGSYTDDGDEGCFDGPYSLDALAEGANRPRYTHTVRAPRHAIARTLTTLHCIALSFTGRRRVQRRG